METFSFLPKSSALNASILSHFPSFGRSLHLNHSSVHLSKPEGLYGQLIPIKDTVTSFLASLSYAQLLIFAVCVAWALGPVIKRRPGVTNAVYHGYRSWLEPTFLVQARYIISARNIITSGYQKVRISSLLNGLRLTLEQYRDTPFVVRRWDTDITVLPNKYLNELRLYPPTKLSGVKAQVAVSGHMGIIAPS